MCLDIDKVSAHSRWPPTTGVAQGRYYCTWNLPIPTAIFAGSVPVVRLRAQDWRAKGSWVRILLATIRFGTLPIPRMSCLEYTLSGTYLRVRPSPEPKRGCAQVRSEPQAKFYPRAVELTPDGTGVTGQK